MYNIYIIFMYQLCMVLRACAQEIPQSPCPRILRYEFVDQPADPAHSNVRGVITIPFRPSTGCTYVLNVMLELPVYLNSKYAPGLSLKYNVPEILGKLSAGTLREVVYYLHFQRFYPIPSVIEIRFNGGLVCRSNSLPVGRGKTTLKWHRWFSIPLGYTIDSPSFPDVRPTDTDTFSFPQDYNVEIPLENSHILHEYKPPDVQTRPIRKLPWEMRGFEDCGLEDIAQKLIFGGESIENGEGPWMVPLMKKNGKTLDFLCTSTLISTKHTITAAHCVKGETENNIIAYVGVFNITAPQGDGAQARSVKKIHTHPKFSRPPDYDLAILELSHKVNRSVYVNPACIWIQNQDLKQVENKTATVFGWGMYSRNSGHTDTPRIARVPIVTQDTCRESHSDLAYLTSRRTLCAGTRDGKGPCRGDSGGGLLLPQRDGLGRTRWVLRGVTSSSLSTPSGECDLYNYIVFSDVAKYNSWILRIIAKWEV